MPITNGLITLDEAKLSIFNSTTPPSTYDTDIEDYVEAATPVIEDIVGPMYERDSEYTRDGGDWSVVLPHAFNSVGSITEDGVTVTDYVANLTAGIIHAGTSSAPRVFASGLQNIVITVNEGPTEVPPNVKLATRELVRHWWQQGRQGNRPGFGNDPADTVQTPQGFAVPRRVMELCKPHREVGGFA